MNALTLARITPICVSLIAAAEPPADEPPTLGHSAHGVAFDVGPRQKPTLMEGIGATHFPITTSVPEVQQWFDQGNTLLHNFWYHEAERSFRWCLKLDPECAMAYWGLARCVQNPFSGGDRGETFLREAVARMDDVTEREQAYIDAWANAMLPERVGDLGPFERFKLLPKEIEKLVIAYPDDIEAKALFAVASLFNETRYGSEAVIREILGDAPEHPGAHHYRIHLWDGSDDGQMALDSCEAYGRIARNSGHANHMPGHVYSGLGMWHEAAIWMDSATRVEQKYMAETMTLPYHNWNYAHNRNYLCFIQEQLGMPSLALDAARRLIAVPLDPEYNASERRFGSVHAEGLAALTRALAKYERWAEILEPGTIPWGDGNDALIARNTLEIRAHLGLGDVEAAEAKRREVATALREQAKERGRPDMEPPPGYPTPEEMIAAQLNEIDGRIALAKGELLEGHRLLAEAAEAQYENYQDDPPLDPGVVYTTLGEAHLDADSPGMAVACFERSLEIVHNDAFALSGLARAHHALGDSESAREAYGRLLHVWSDAEPGLRWLDDVAALGLDAEPIDESPRDQRRYARATLDQLGPQRWMPYAAPTLDALDSTGERVTLDDYAGRNVLLVFYLGDECTHCMEQLNAIAEKKDEFESREVELVAICSKTVQEHADSIELGELPFRLLSDSDHTNARRFHAYDDFEDMELHATILIDGAGDIRWVRAGGDPFMDLDFLIGEIDRIVGIDELESEVVATR